MTQTTAPREGDAWLAAPLRLADDVTLLVGANDQHLLYHRRLRTYVRVGAAGAALLRRLDGRHTGADLLAGSHQPDRVRLFLADLRAAHALNVPAPPVRGRRRVLSALLSRNPRRLRLVGPAPRALAAPAGLLRRVPARPAAAILAVAAPVTALAAALAAVGHPVTTAPGLAGWALVAVAVLGQMALHETAHAVVCQALGVPIREAGIRLWSVVFPVPYVDRTDAYRVRRRAHRVAIALAGPVVDVTAAGACALLVLAVDGPALRVLLLLQLLVLANNLNPVLPTDGHQAVEAALGELNLRHRAHGYLAHLVLRLPLSSALRGVSASRRLAYAAYGVFSLAYLTCLLGVVGLSVARLWTGAA